MGKSFLLKSSLLLMALLPSGAALAQQKTPQELDDERMARAILSAIRAQAQGDPEPSAQTRKQKRVWPKHESAEPLPSPSAVADQPPVILPYTPGAPPPDSVPESPPVILHYTPDPPPPDSPPAAPAAVEPPPPAVPEPPPVVASPPPPPPPPPPPAAPASNEPLAGISTQTAFLRSPDNMFVLFPSGRVQADGYFFKSGNKTPFNTLLLRRARLELTGWVDNFVFFSIAGDFASGAPAGANPIAQSNLNATDDYVALAPFKDFFIFQMGQFDAPFTLENRTSDKYLEFMEKSIAVRAFGAPSGKEVGAMVHGTNPDRNFYYSLGLFDGDGQNFRNADNQFDVIGRAWVAPLLGGVDALKAVTVGGSFWTGDRNNALIAASQSTQAGFGFFNPAWTWTSAMGTKTPVELHQVGRLQAWAAELNAPVAHKFGGRFEFIWKKQPLSAMDVTNAKAPVILGGETLKGWAAYGMLWLWAIGDDRIVGEPGLQTPGRFGKFGVKPPDNGLQLALKIDYLDETVSEASDAAALTLKSPVTGGTKVDSYEFGINYWRSRRFRATFNYLLNHFGGDTATIKALKSRFEQEFLFRLAIAL
ncbi:MAG TPA: porin [Polyangia bacterium]|nr:porin [Polyangia bacterium]